MPLHRDYRYILGLDLGQANDYTSLSITKQEWHMSHRRYEYELQFLERVRGMSYPLIVQKVQKIMIQPELMASEPPILVLDKTGVGAPVCDMFNPKFNQVSATGQMQLVSSNKYVIEITITAGHTPSRVPGGYHVPKRDLIFALLAIYQSERIKVAKTLELAKTLTGELTNLKLKINTNGNDTYSAWRESEHDDLVLSLALPAWYAEYKYARRHRSPGPKDRARNRGRK